MSRINESVFRDIRRILSSLKDSSDIKYVFENGSVKIFKRGSPYVSHREMVFDFGHGFEKTIYIANNRFAILVDEGYCFEPESGIKDEVRLEYILSFLVRDILPDWYRPDWLNNGLIRIIYPNRFAGLTEDGKPIFREEVRQIFEEKGKFEIYGKFRKII